MQYCVQSSSIKQLTYSNQPENLGGLGKIWGGLCPPGPSLEPPLLPAINPLNLDPEKTRVQKNFLLRSNLSYPKIHRGLNTALRYAVTIHRRWSPSILWVVGGVKESFHKLYSAVKWLTEDVGVQMDSCRRFLFRLILVSFFVASGFLHITTTATILQ